MFIIHFFNSLLNYCVGCSDSVKQEDESSRDPNSNLVIGLAHYELWISNLPKEMKQENSKESCMQIKSETMLNNSDEERENVKGEDAASIFETFSNLHYHSEASVMNNLNVNQRPDVEVSEAKSIEHEQEFQLQDSLMISAKTSSEKDGSRLNDFQIQFSSAYNLQSKFYYGCPMFCSLATNSLFSF